MDDVDTKLPSPDPTPKSFFFHSPPDSPDDDAPAAYPPIPPSTAGHGAILAEPGHSPRRRPSTAAAVASRLRFRTSRALRPSTADGTSLARRLGHKHSATHHDEDRTTWQLDADPFALSPKLKSASPAATIDAPLKRLGPKMAPAAEGLVTLGKQRTQRIQPPAVATITPDFGDVIDIRAKPRGVDKEAPEARPHSPTLVTQDCTRQPVEQQPVAPPVISRVDASLPPIPPSTPASIHATDSGPGDIRCSPRIHTDSDPPPRPSHIIPGLPSFPSTYAKLSPSITRHATFQRYVTPHSTLSHLLSRSRAWKARLIGLSAFPVSSTRFTCFLHVFKLPTAQGDNVEMDRLEITEDGVVFVADEEVGGRKHVLRVGGLDVGNDPAKRDHVTHHPPQEAKGQWLTICFFRIDENHAMQEWIEAIREIIASRRAHISPAGTTPGSIHNYGGLHIPTAALPEISPVSPMGSTFLYPQVEDRVPAATLSEESLSARSPARNSTVSVLRGFFSSSALPSIVTMNRSKHQSLLPSQLNGLPNGEGEVAKNTRTSFRNSITISPYHRPSILLSSLSQGPITPVEESPVGDIADPPAPMEAEHPVDTSAKHISVGSNDRSSEEEKPSNPDSGDFSTAMTSVENIDTSRPSITAEQDDHRAETLEVLTQGRSSPTPPSLQVPSAGVLPLPVPTGPQNHPARGHDDIKLARPARVRYSTQLPDMQKLPLRPLPPPPSPPINNITPTSSSDSSFKRLSGFSNVIPHAVTYRSGSRLSALFSRDLGSPSSRVSMAPPRSPPTASLPPIPLNGDAGLSTPPATMRQRVGSSGSTNSFHLHEKTIPPMGPIPTGALPPLPDIVNEDMVQSPALSRERPRLSSAPSIPRVGLANHPFGTAIPSETLLTPVEEPPDTPRRHSFVEPLTPPDSAYLYEFTEKSEEKPFMPSEKTTTDKPTPPRRSSKRPAARPVKLIVMNPEDTDGRC